MRRRLLQRGHLLVEGSLQQQEATKASLILQGTIGCTLRNIYLSEPLGRMAWQRKFLLVLDTRLLYSD
jgi:hypothetical protein